MIISASRRTDIPAFYSEWLLRRLEEGFVLTVNPFNTHQVSRISLRPEDVDCIVFWTKNAAPMLPRLQRLEEWKFYFQFTLTPYGKDVEPGLPPKDAVVRTFQELSRRLGGAKGARVVWRYDPILLTEQHTIAWHREQFARLLEQLAPYTDCCVISFLDLYSKTERNTNPLGLMPLEAAQMEEIAGSFAELADGSGLVLKSCSEAIDLAKYGIEHGSCIDKARIERVMGVPINVKKDSTQRQECGCMKSVDIGAYNTCRHLCRYCYANFNADMAKAQHAQHDPQAPVLGARLTGMEKITDRKVEHLACARTEQAVQIELF